MSYHNGLHFALSVVGTVVDVAERVAEFVGSDEGSIASLGSVALALHHLKSLHAGGSREGVIFLRGAFAATRLAWKEMRKVMWLAIPLHPD